MNDFSSPLSWPVVRESAEVAGVEFADALVDFPDVALQVLLRVEPLGTLWGGGSSIHHSSVTQSLPP